jgi:hypothetical protein
LSAPSSRYAQDRTYQAALPSGGTVTALLFPAPRTPAPVGFHPRSVGDRLDLLAVKYLNDPTGFWRILDANNSLLAGALEARALIGIPGVTDR